jgi:hypothetical protein
MKKYCWCAQPLARHTSTASPSRPQKPRQQELCLVPVPPPTLHRWFCPTLPPAHVEDSEKAPALNPKP